MKSQLVLLFKWRIFATGVVPAKKKKKKKRSVFDIIIIRGMGFVTRVISELSEAEGRAPVGIMEFKKSLYWHSLRILF